MMRRFSIALSLALLALIPIPIQAAVETTTVQGKIIIPDGTQATAGSLTLQLSQGGTSADTGTGQQQAVGGSKSTTIASDGSISFALVPNDAITPTGTFYQVTYSVTAPIRAYWTEKWSVTTSPDPVNIGAITRLEVAPGITVGSFTRFVATQPTGTCTAADVPTFAQNTNRLCECVASAWSCGLAVGTADSNSPTGIWDFVGGTLRLARGACPPAATACDAATEEGVIFVCDVEASGAYVCVDFTKGWQRFIVAEASGNLFFNGSRVGFGPTATSEATSDVIMNPTTPVGAAFFVTERGGDGRPSFSIKERIFGVGAAIDFLDGNGVPASGIHFNQGDSGGVVQLGDVYITHFRTTKIRTSTTATGQLAFSIDQPANTPFSIWDNGTESKYRYDFYNDAFVQFTGTEAGSGPMDLGMVNGYGNYCYSPPGPGPSQQFSEGKYCGEVTLDDDWDGNGCSASTTKGMLGVKCRGGIATQCRTSVPTSCGSTALGYIDEIALCATGTDSPRKCCCDPDADADGAYRDCLTGTPCVAAQASTAALVVGPVTARDPLTHLQPIAGDTGSNAALLVQWAGESGQRFRLNKDGSLVWGPGGAAPTDTNLYRSSADVLKTDDSFVAGNLTAIGTGDFQGSLVVPNNPTVPTACAAGKVFMKNGTSPTLCCCDTTEDGDGVFDVCGSDTNC